MSDEMTQIAALLGSREGVGKPKRLGYNQGRRRSKMDIGRVVRRVTKLPRPTPVKLPKPIPVPAPVPATIPAPAPVVPDGDKKGGTR